jgi:hypothetical protein
MNFIEYLTTLEKVSLNGITPWLQQLYLSDHSWKNGEQTFKVAEMKRKYVVNNVLLYGIDSKLIDGQRVNILVTFDDGMPCVDDMGEDVYELSYDLSYVNVVSLIKYVADDIKDKYLIPEKLLVLAGIEVKQGKYSGGQAEIDTDTKQELETLRLEKLKWDASITAATKIGMVFYENGDDRKMLKEEFVNTFSEQLGKDLPDTTVEKIYKALPIGFRQLGGRPKKETAPGNVDDVIPAAVFIGTLHEAPERLKLESVKEELKENSIKVPDDEILKKIIATLKKLDV